MQGRGHGRALKQAIAATLQGHVFPNLLERTGAGRSKLANSSAREEPLMERRVRARPQDDDITLFAVSLCAGNQRETEQLFQEWLDQGIDASVLFEDLLGESAKLLGDKWLTDELSFGDVTIGMASLHTLMRKFSRELTLSINAKPVGRSILVTPLPAGNHMFGSVMVEEFFRAYGWDVESGINNTENDILDAVHRVRFDVLGISVGATSQLKQVRRLISKARKHSKNEAIAIMVGGPPFIEQPERVDEVGADATARSAEKAIKIAMRLTEGSVE